MLIVIIIIINLFCVDKFKNLQKNVYSCSFKLIQINKLKNILKKLKC